MRISDWSSDVCSSDLADEEDAGDAVEPAREGAAREPAGGRSRPEPDQRQPEGTKAGVDAAEQEHLEADRPQHRADELRQQGEVEDDDLRVQQVGDYRLSIDPRRRGGGSLRPRAFGRSRSPGRRSEEHTSELQSLMRISYAVFCLKKQKN